MRTIDSIKFKFTAAVFVLVTAVTVLLGVVSYEYEKRAIENRLYAQLNAIADLKKKLVVDFLNERKNDLKVLATADYLRKQLSILLDRSGDARSKKTASRYVRRRLATFKEIYLGYQGLEIAGLDGAVIVSSEEGRAGVGMHARHEHRTILSPYAEALKRGAVVIRQNNVDEGHLDFAVGIQGGDGKAQAVISSSVGLADTLFPIFSDYTGLGHTGETLLVKRNGSRISFVNPTRHRPVPIDGHAVYGEEYLKLAKLATSGNEGIDQGIDYRGKAVIGAYRLIPSLGWGVVAKIDADEAFAEIADLRRRTFFLALAVLSVMLVIVYFLVRKFSSPITELIQKTKAITSGHYMFLAESGRRNEIGELEENFNMMVVALDEARREAEMQQEYLARKVGERTENLARANEALSKALEEVRQENAEKKKLEAQLLHAQKMEAVGTLAGGVAHDFNNILTAIIGYGNVIRMKLGEDDPLREYLDQILATSERAASLTHSLLAFSRKQIINPQPVKLNEIIGRVQKLLARLMGEDIELRLALSDADPTVMADSGQVEQVLMNLATNARDAMPAGGMFTITTAIEDINEQYVALHGYGVVGKYAVVIVGDTGAGMDEKTRSRIFEPFFTTKETGRGTGLGLSIVYGIIKQQNGYINCYSEPGKGTTFKIFLPLTHMAVDGKDAEDSRLPEGGRETILIAEDSAEVRSLTKTVLTEFGYTVIEAVDGEDAVKKFNEHRDAIHLLLCDIIMPKKNGKDAYEEIRKGRPGVKVIFTSGYTADIVRQKGFLDEGLTLLSKPLSPRDLLRKIREVLDQ